jgi:intron-binding protein aquarius
LGDSVESVDYGDTFLNAEHVIDSFAGKDIVFEVNGQLKSVASTSRQHLPPPPYAITVERSCAAAASSSAEGSKSSSSSSKRSRMEPASSSSSSSSSSEKVIVRHYARGNQGPYPEDAVRVNQVRFTPTQVEAIRSGVNPGLTMVVGPPGTGKTDVAVQIIVNLYKNHPTQKILVVTHSNAALNDLFEKIMERDVAPRHLLRLGSGELELRDALSVAGAGGGGKGQGEAFSKQGRVNWSLSRRLQLLAQVQRLSASLGVAGDVGNTCETAEYFQLEYVQSRIEKFNIDVAADSKEEKSIESLFPFSAYFADAPSPLFAGSDRDAHLESARGCFVHINKIFAELKDYRAFELLRSQNLRSDYLLTTQVNFLIVGNGLLLPLCCV